MGCCTAVPQARACARTYLEAVHEGQQLVGLQEGVVETQVRFHLYGGSSGGGAGMGWKEASAWQEGGWGGAICMAEARKGKGKGAHARGKDARGTARARNARQRRDGARARGPTAVCRLVAGLGWWAWQAKKHYILEAIKTPKP